MTESMSVKRPGVVTLVVIFLWLIAITSVLVGLALVIGSQSDDIIAETGRTDTELLWTGIVELAIGVIVALVAIALASGSRGARTFVAVVAGIRIAATIFIVALYHTTGSLVAGFLHVIVPLFVLWALYGHDKSEAYFEQYS